MFRNIMIEKPAGWNGAHRKAVFWKSHIWSGQGARVPLEPNRRGGTHFFSDESSPLKLPRHPRKMLPSLLDPTSLATCSPNAPPHIVILWSFFGISFKRFATQVAKYSRSGVALGVLYRLLPETGVLEAKVTEAWAEATSVDSRRTPR